MILKEMKIVGFGPFYEEVTIHIEDNVTILTGANDVGKSAILRLIKLICHGDGVIQTDVNYDNAFDFGGDWKLNETAQCTVKFVTTPLANIYIPSQPDIELSSVVELDYRFASGRREVRSINGKKQRIEGRNIPIGYPTVIYVDDQAEIPYEISLDSEKPLEKLLLNLIFGADGGARFLHAREGDDFDYQLGTGNERLNQSLSSFLPKVLGVSLDLRARTVDGINRIQIGFRNTPSGILPPTIRGKGLRKILSVLVQLSAFNSVDRHTIILIDEPENSLHADSQHLLRRTLETFAKSENIQVIYATHSPSMINTLHPEGIRLFYREQLAVLSTVPRKITTSRIDNKPYRDNFLPVRVQWGLSASDSLQYAPVSIIVEGSTEVLAFPYLLEKLCHEGVSGFGDVEELLNICHFVSGMGDNLKLITRLAKSQGAYPIVFLDGDKASTRDDIRAELDNEVPVILLQQDQEIEDIIKPETYFQAIRDVLEHFTDDQKSVITYEAFSSWEKENEKKLSRKMFSKRIDLWLKSDLLQHLGIRGLDKPRTLSKAIDLVEVSEINPTALNALRELINAIRAESQKV